MLGAWAAQTGIRTPKITRYDDDARTESNPRPRQNQRENHHDDRDDPTETTRDDIMRAALAAACAAREAADYADSYAQDPEVSTDGSVTLADVVATAEHAAALVTELHELIRRLDATL